MIEQPPFDEGNDRGHFTPILAALTIVAAGLLYYFTRHPLLAGFLPWLHGGWRTFDTGLWLLRTDPVRKRARICFGFYLATACWKAAGVAFATMLTFFILTPGGMPDENELIALSLALLAGLVLNSLIGVIAVAAAVACKVRVYVRSDLRNAVRGDLSAAARLGIARKSGLNLGFIVVATAVLLPLMIASTIALAIMTLDRKANAPASTAEVVCICLVLFGGPLAAIPLFAWLSPRVIARTPWECWPEGSCVAQPTVKDSWQ